MIIGDPNSSLGMAAPWAAALSIVLLIVLGGGIVLLLCRRLHISWALGIGIFLGFAAIGAIVTLLFGPFFLAADGPTYDRQAMGIVDVLRGESETGVRITGGKEGWPAILAGLYFIFGRVPFLGILVNSLALAIAAVFAVKTAQITWGSYSQWRIVVFLFFNPLVVFLGPSMMREALSWMGISVVSCGLAMVFKSDRRGILLILLGEILLFWVRSTLSVLLAAGLGVASAVVYLVLKRRFWLLGLTAVAIVVIGLTMGESILSMLGQNEEYLRLNRENLSEDAVTGFAIKELGEGPLGFLGGAIALAPRLAFGPYLWEIGLAPVWIWVFANTIVWFALLAFAVWQTRKLPNRAASAVLWAAVAIVLVGMALTLTNYGIVVRLRGIPYMMLLPLVIASKPFAGAPDVSIGHNRSAVRYLARWLAPRRHPPAGYLSVPRGHEVSNFVSSVEYKNRTTSA